MSSKLWMEKTDSYGINLAVACGKIVLGGILGHEFGKRLSPIKVVALTALELFGELRDPGESPEGLHRFRKMKVVSIVRGFRCVALYYTCRWGLNRAGWLSKIPMGVNGALLLYDAYYALNHKKKVMGKIRTFFDLPRKKVF